MGRGPMSALPYDAKGSGFQNVKCSWVPFLGRRGTGISLATFDVLYGIKMLANGKPQVQHRGPCFSPGQKAQSQLPLRTFFGLRKPHRLGAQSVVTRIGSRPVRQARTAAFQVIALGLMPARPISVSNCNAPGQAPPPSQALMTALKLITSACCELLTTGVKWKGSHVVWADM